MSLRRSWSLPWSVAALAVLNVSSLGCGRTGPSGVATPSIDPAVAADKAVELYDKNGDAVLDTTELTASPGILSVVRRYDTDGDQRISRDEIAARLSTLYASGTGLMPFTCRVLRGEQPVSGATVRFLPEPFLGGAIQAAEGITDGDGTAVMAIPDHARPDDQRGLQSIQPGVYRVRISGPGPGAADAKVLGCEADPMSRDGSMAEFEW